MKKNISSAEHGAVHDNPTDTPPRSMRRGRKRSDTPFSGRLRQLLI
jgi:hypothetical protein